MREENIDNLKVLRFPGLDGKKGVNCAVSTRPGGISSGRVTGLNIGYAEGDDQQNIAENRRRFWAAAGLPETRAVFMRQCHSANVAVADAKTELEPLDTARGLANVDAVITAEPGTALCALSADCAVTVFYDERNRALGVAHSGWRGAAMNIYAATVAAMKMRYGTRPGDLYAGVGPMISAEHYPVREDFLEKLQSFYPPEACRRFLTLKEGLHHFNLRELLRHQLMELGVARYEFSHLCTYSNPELLYSYRRDGAGAGRFGLAASLI